MTRLLQLHHTLRGQFQRPPAEDSDAQVHFHQGPQGQPAPCFDARCESPHLSV
jgi:hypothetical protein